MMKDVDAKKTGQIRDTNVQLIKIIILYLLMAFNAWGQDQERPQPINDGSLQSNKQLLVVSPIHYENVSELFKRQISKIYLKVIYTLPNFTPVIGNFTPTDDSKIKGTILNSKIKIYLDKNSFCFESQIMDLKKNKGLFSQQKCHIDEKKLISTVEKLLKNLFTKVNGEKKKY